MSKAPCLMAHLCIMFCTSTFCHCTHAQSSKSNDDSSRCRTCVSGVLCQHKVAFTYFCIGVLRLVSWYQHWVDLWSKFKMQIWLLHSQPPIECSEWKKQNNHIAITFIAIVLYIPDNHFWGCAVLLCSLDNVVYARWCCFTSWHESGTILQ